MRVAPNEVSFNTASSWRDIYGPRKGVGTFIKSEFYDGGNFASESLSIVSERDPKNHAEMRKYLSSAFSDRSMKAQEPLIAECADNFIEKLGEAGKAVGGTDMTMWFNLTTFDIIGSLALSKLASSTFGWLLSRRVCVLVLLLTVSDVSLPRQLFFRKCSLV